jgi:hypothetical protein
VTDRELLELAAKAAGIVYANGWNLATNEPWCPHEDDGDAFQLMVKLGLLYDDMLFHYISLERFKTKDVDDATAIRRGIVRAAAEDGRNMQ